MLLPLVEKTPVSLFSRYTIDVYGTGPIQYNLNIDVKFITAAKDTTLANAIPVLVIDTVCISGECIDSLQCVLPLSDFEWRRIRRYRIRDTSSATDYVYPQGYIVPFRDEDLDYMLGELVPNGFHLDTAFYIPAACSDSVVLLEITARLLNRMTKEVLDREVRQIPMKVISGNRIYPFGR